MTIISSSGDLKNAKNGQTFTKMKFIKKIENLESSRKINLRNLYKDILKFFSLEIFENTVNELLINNEIEISTELKIIKGVVESIEYNYSERQQK